METNTSEYLGSHETETCQDAGKPPLILPDDLTDYDQWVLWQYEQRGGNDVKVPKQISGDNASTSDPSTWTDFESASREYLCNEKVGIGFVFTSGDPFVGIDLDDCIDDDGNYKPWASDIIAKFETYIEYSPSGTGIKIFAKGHIGSAVKANYQDGAVEIYSSGRYFTMTGVAIEHGVNSVEDCQASIDWLSSRVRKTTGSTTNNNGTQWQAGGRNNRLTSLAGSMRRKGMSPESILAALLAENERKCLPPLSDDEVRSIAKSIARYGPSEEAVELAPDSSFFITSKGVYYRRQKKENEEQEPAPIWICSPLEIVGITRDANSESWGKYLRWTDLDGNEHSWSMPVEMLIGSETEVQKTLVYGGLRIGTAKSSRDLLGRYLNETNPSKQYRCVDRLGWHGDCYVLPDRTIGHTEEEIIYQSALTDNPYSSRGTLREWQDGVASMAANNSRLVFALCVGFAAPCLSLIDTEGGGFHFTGASSIGKSTAAFGAASIFGCPKDFMLNWRATSNGMESRAAQRNDSLMPIDEIGQADPRDVGDAMYMLANGSGKERMNRNGSSRKSYKWKTLFLSNGEKSLSEHMASSGQKVKGGQEVRCLDIPADAGKGFGLFEDLHDFLAKEPNKKTRSGSFAIEFKRQAEQYYGTAGLAFIEKIAGQRAKITESLIRFIDQYVNENKIAGMSAEVFRALQKFGLVAAAGELATSLGITGWQTGEANRAVSICFRAWLDKRGGNGAADVQAGIRQVRLFLERNPERFQEIIEVGGKLDFARDLRNINRAGFKRRNADDESAEYEYYVLPEVFRSEVCQGHNPGLIAEALADGGYLERASDRRLTVSKRLPGLGNPRVYVIRSSLFE